ncbi:Transcriptional regulatory protein WalR [Thalassocella blandensis]|nr:Transcriptional regulatory protein WalR [Thalassocella blandensis]
MTRSEKIEEKLALLREKFNAELPIQLNTVDDIWSRLTNIQWDSAKLGKLHQIVHQLAGIGGSFGYTELTKAARELDVMLRTLVSQNSAPEAQVKKQIAQQIVALTKAAGVPDKVNHLANITSLSLNRKILIVDDDGNQADLLKSMCQELGCHVTVLNSPGMLDQQLKIEVPDAIIMDIVFPEGQQAGLESVKRIVSGLDHKIPVIFSSSRSDLVSRVKASRAGGLGFLSKPIQASELKQQLKKLVNLDLVKEKILIVDDDIQVTELISNVLAKKGYVCASCHRPSEIIHHLEKFQPGLILLDINMPTIKGDELLVVLGQEEKYARIPTLVISSDVSAVNVAVAMSNGASGFIPKPVDFKLLDKTISTVLNRRMLSQAPVPSSLPENTAVSSVVGRSQFAKEIKRIIGKADEGLHYLAYVSFRQYDVVKMDVGLESLDAVADALLKKIAGGLNDGEWVTNISQFQFCMLLQEETAVSIDDRVHAISDGLKTVQLDGKQKLPGLEPCISVIELSARFSSADEAIYLAELEAQKLFHVADRNIAIQKSIASPSLSDKQLSSLVMRALETQRLHLSYQPVFDVNGNERIFEALSRLEDDNNTIILPEHFIQTIVAAGKEYEFNKLIVSTCIKDIKQLHGKELQETEIIVKLKMGKFSMLSFLTWVSNCLVSANLRGENRLIFSVTEKDLWQHFESIQVLNKGLIDIHCGLMIEQVGSPDNPSLEALKKSDELDVSYYKLHPTFTQKLVNPESASDAEAQMLDILASKQAPIIATHVENNATFNKLWNMGIRYFQGYFFSKPDAALSFNFEVENADIESHSKFL